MVRRRLIFFAAALATAQPGWAVNVRCGDDLEALISFNADQNPPYQDFANANSMLFLADGIENPLAAKVAQRFPNKRIISGDIATTTEKVENGVIYRHVDNCQTLPFKSDSFQAIVMKRGLCFCNFKKADFRDVTCGGVPANPKDAANFLREIVRVLDKAHENSWAFLQGFGGPLRSGKAPYTGAPAYGWGPKLEVWEKASDQIMQEFPDVGIEITTHKHSGDTFYDGIYIRTKPKPSLP